MAGGNLEFKAAGDGPAAQGKRALITGITGQDGSYMAELLLAKGYEVHGVVRRVSGSSADRLEQVIRDPSQGTRLFTHCGDLRDGAVLTRLVAELEPDEIYHLAAQTHVGLSFEIPEYTFDTTALGTVRMLEAMRQAKVDARFCQACSSEMFGSSPPPQSETSPFVPRSPYAIAKVAAFWSGVDHRDAYGDFIVNGILFNHESPRRGHDFVTRKVTRAVARVNAGYEEKLQLGNLDARRDWGYAPDYVEALWLMLQQDEPADLVVATGETHSVRDFLEVAFSHVGLDWERYVEVDARYLRPIDLHELRGDASRSREALGWEPRVRFEELVRLMVDADIAMLEAELDGRAAAAGHD
jgi:GDPmannose 4,6-dehydratase